MAEHSQNIQQEINAGKKYASQVQAELRGKISLFKRHSGKLSKINTRIQMRNLELNAITINTVRYAFIHHYGASERKENETKSVNGKLFTRKAHPFKLTAKKNLEVSDSIIQNLANEIGNLRAESIMARINF